MDGGTGGRKGQANIEQGKHWMVAAFCCFAESRCHIQSSSAFNRELSQLVRNMVSLFLILIFQNLKQKKKNIFQIIKEEKYGLPYQRKIKTFFQLKLGGNELKIEVVHLIAVIFHLRNGSLNIISHFHCQISIYGSQSNHFKPKLDIIFSFYLRKIYQGIQISNIIPPSIFMPPNSGITT